MQPVGLDAVMRAASLESCRFLGMYVGDHFS